MSADMKSYIGSQGAAGVFGGLGMGISRSLKARGAMDALARAAHTGQMVEECDANDISLLDVLKERKKTLEGKLTEVNHAIELLEGDPNIETAMRAIYDVTNNPF